MKNCRMGRGRAAKRKMVEANLRLVHSLAHQFHGQGLSHTELCQEGVLGLLKSTERFDCTRRTKFSSYAFFWVKEQMGGAVKKFGRALRMAQSVPRTVSLLLRHKDEFEQEHGRKPTLDELVEVSEVDAKRVQDVFRITVPVKSLDASGLFLFPISRSPCTFIHICSWHWFALKYIRIITYNCLKFVFV
jgi:RNA polymerase primary sigma factor